MELKEGDKVYSFYTHRQGILKRIKWETAIVQWEDGKEQLVPLGTLRKVPTLSEVRQVFSRMFRRRIPIAQVVNYLEKIYGERVFPVLEEVMDEFMVQPGDVYLDKRQRKVRVVSTKGDLVNVEFSDGSRERIPKRTLTANFIKIKCK